MLNDVPNVKEFGGMLNSLYDGTSIMKNKKTPFVPSILLLFCRKLMFFSAAVRGRRLILPLEVALDFKSSEKKRVFSELIDRFHLT